MLFNMIHVTIIFLCKFCIEICIHFGYTSTRIDIELASATEYYSSSNIAKMTPQYKQI